MNKTLLFLASCLFTASITAQLKVKPGVRTGFNLANISNTSFDTRVGPYLGVYADIRFSSFYAMQPEITYSNQGGKSNISSVGDLKIDYISIGLANKFYIIPNQGLHLIVGPSFDIDFENNFISLVNGNSDSEVLPFDLSIFGGIGYEFDFGLTLEARYKQGLLDIDWFNSDFNNGIYDGDGNTLNVVFQIGAAYKFDFKR